MLIALEFNPKATKQGSLIVLLAGGGIFHGKVQVLRIVSLQEN